MQDSFSCPTIVAVGFISSIGADARRFSPFGSASLARKVISRATAGDLGGGKSSRIPADLGELIPRATGRRRESCACEADGQTLLAIGEYPQPLLYIVRRASSRARGMIS